MFKRSLIFVLVLILVMLLPACKTKPGLANPASVYCEEQGGTVEIWEDAEGNQTGFCLFPDGSECEEWAYYRGECQPGE